MLEIFIQHRSQPTLYFLDATSDDGDSIDSVVAFEVRSNLLHSLQREVSYVG